MLPLTLRQRYAVYLRDLQGWPIKDIAEEMGITVGAVGTHLGRARRKLGRQQQDRHHGHGYYGRIEEAAARVTPGL